ncbi:hypothetical protein EON82_26190 [bacterium]|nr:MAG: hypothetical protein EON82_26190 [bacterium]
MASLLFGHTDALRVQALSAAATIYAIHSPNAFSYYVLFGVGGGRASMFITLAAAVASLAGVAIGATRFGSLGAVFGNAVYIGVWALTVVGMRSIRIPTSRWVSLVMPYGAWLIAIVGVSSIVPERAVVRAAVALTASMLLFAVLLRRQPALLGCILRRSDSRMSRERRPTGDSS